MVASPSRTAVMIGLGCALVLLAGRWVTASLPERTTSRVAATYESGPLALACRANAKSHPLEHVRFFIPAMQAEETIHKALPSILAALSPEGFHLRPAYDDRTLWLDVEGPTEEAERAALAWRTSALNAALALREKALQDAPPDERTCLSQRLLRFQADETPPVRLIDPPTTTEYSVLLALSFLLGALAWLTPPRPRRPRAS